MSHQFKCFVYLEGGIAESEYLRCEGCGDSLNSHTGPVAFTNLESCESLATQTLYYIRSIRRTTDENSSDRLFSVAPSKEGPVITHMNRDAQAEIHFGVYALKISKVILCKTLHQHLCVSWNFSLRAGAFPEPSVVAERYVREYLKLPNGEPFNLPHFFLPIGSKKNFNDVMDFAATEGSKLPPHMLNTSASPDIAAREKKFLVFDFELESVDDASGQDGQDAPTFQCPVSPFSDNKLQFYFGTNSNDWPHHCAFTEAKKNNPCSLSENQHFFLSGDHNSISRVRYFLQSDLDDYNTIRCFDRKQDGSLQDGCYGHFALYSADLLLPDDSPFLAVQGDRHVVAYKKTDGTIVGKDYYASATVANHLAPCILKLNLDGSLELFHTAASGCEESTKVLSGAPDPSKYQAPFRLFLKPNGAICIADRNEEIAFVLNQTYPDYKDQPGFSFIENDIKAIWGSSPANAALAPADAAAAEQAPVEHADAHDPLNHADAHDPLNHADARQAVAYYAQAAFVCGVTGIVFKSFGSALLASKCADGIGRAVAVGAGCAAAIGLSMICKNFKKCNNGHPLKRAEQLLPPCRRFICRICYNYIERTDSQSKKWFLCDHDDCRGYAVCTNFSCAIWAAAYSKQTGCPCGDANCNDCLHKLQTAKDPLDLNGFKNKCTTQVSQSQFVSVSLLPPSMCQPSLPHVPDVPCGFVAAVANLPGTLTRYVVQCAVPYRIHFDSRTCTQVIPANMIIEISLPLQGEVPSLDVSSEDIAHAACCGTPVTCISFKHHDGRPFLNQTTTAGVRIAGVHIVDSVIRRNSTVFDYVNGPAKDFLKDYINDPSSLDSVLDSATCVRIEISRQAFIGKEQFTFHKLPDGHEFSPSMISDLLENPPQIVLVQGLFSNPSPPSDSPPSPPQIFSSKDDSVQLFTEGLADRVQFTQGQDISMKGHYYVFFELVFPDFVHWAPRLDDDCVVAEAFVNFVKNQNSETISCLTITKELIAQNSFGTGRVSKYVLPLDLPDLGEGEKIEYQVYLESTVSTCPQFQVRSTGCSVYKHKEHKEHKDDFSWGAFLISAVSVCGMAYQGSNVLAAAVPKVLGAAGAATLALPQKLKAYSTLAGNTLSMSSILLGMTAMCAVPVGLLTSMPVSPPPKTKSKITTKKEIFYIQFPSTPPPPPTSKRGTITKMIPLDANTLRQIWCKNGSVLSFTVRFDLEDQNQNFWDSLPPNQRKQRKLWIQFPHDTPEAALPKDRTHNVRLFVKHDGVHTCISEPDYHRYFPCLKTPNQMFLGEQDACLQIVGKTGKRHSCEWFHLHVLTKNLPPNLLNQINKTEGDNVFYLLVDFCFPDVKHKDAFPPINKPIKISATIEPYFDESSLPIGFPNFRGFWTLHIAKRDVQDTVVGGFAEHFGLHLQCWSKEDRLGTLLATVEMDVTAPILSTDPILCTPQGVPPVRFFSDPSVTKICRANRAGSNGFQTYLETLGDPVSRDLKKLILSDDARWQSNSSTNYSAFRMQRKSHHGWFTIPRKQIDVYKHVHLFDHANHVQQQCNSRNLPNVSKFSRLNCSAATTIQLQASQPNGEGLTDKSTRDFSGVMVQLHWSSRSCREFNEQYGTRHVSITGFKHLNDIVRSFLEEARKHPYHLRLLSIAQLEKPGNSYHHCQSVIKKWLFNPLFPSTFGAQLKSGFQLFSGRGYFKWLQKSKHRAEMLYQGKKKYSCPNVL